METGTSSPPIRNAHCALHNHLHVISPLEWNISATHVHLERCYDEDFLNIVETVEQVVASRTKSAKPKTMQTHSFRRKKTMAFEMRSC